MPGDSIETWVATAEGADGKWEYAGSVYGRKQLSGLVGPRDKFGFGPTCDGWRGGGAGITLLVSEKPS